MTLDVDTDERDRPDGLAAARLHRVGVEDVRSDRLARVAARRRGSGRRVVRVDPRPDRRHRGGRACGRQVPAAASATRRGRRCRRRETAGSRCTTSSATATARFASGSRRSCRTRPPRSSARSRSRTGGRPVRALRARQRRRRVPVGAGVLRPARRPATRVALGANPTVVARLTGAEPRASARSPARPPRRTSCRPRRSCSRRSPRCSASKAPGAGSLVHADALRPPSAARTPHGRGSSLAEKGLALRGGRDRPRRPAGLDLREEPARARAGLRGGRRARAPRVRA